MAQPINKYSGYLGRTLSNTQWYFIGVPMTTLKQQCEENSSVNHSLSTSQDPDAIKPQHLPNLEQRGIHPSMEGVPTVPYCSILSATPMPSASVILWFPSFSIAIGGGKGRLRSYRLSTSESDPLLLPFPKSLPASCFIVRQYLSQCR